MSLINQFMERIFKPTQPLAAGIYQYLAPPEEPLHYRLHLRIDNNGQGVLILNASTVLHLNQTAAEYAYHLLHHTPEEEASRQVAKRYRVSRRQALQDYHNFKERIATLIEIPDLDPSIFLDFERQEPYTNLVAPYRLDCAITYRLPDEKDQSATPVSRVKRELETEEWRAILGKIWEAGIPHVNFTGGEPTLRQDLPALLDHADQMGMVTGVLSDGLRFGDKKYLVRLLEGGLDHLMVTLDPKQESFWKALKNILAEDIYLTVHLTLTQKDPSTIRGLLDRLAQMGVPSVSLSASDPAFKQSLEALQNAAAELGMRLVWDLPVPYSHLNPVSLELKEAGVHAEGAGNAWLYIEPDGDVLPAQGVPRVLGNLLSDRWEEIWKKH